jgi:hypothetical protein
LACKNPSLLSITETMILLRSLNPLVLNNPAIETYTFSLGPYDRKNKLL